MKAKDLKIRDDLEVDESQIDSQVKQTGFQAGSAKESFSKFGRETIKNLAMQNVPHIQKEAALAKEFSDLTGGKSMTCPRCGTGVLAAKVYAKNNGNFISLACTEYNPNLPDGSCNYTRIISWEIFKKEFKEKKL